MDWRTSEDIANYFSKFDTGFNPETFNFELKQAIDTLMINISKRIDSSNANPLLLAEDVVIGAKYELTFIPVDWNCPFCKSENSTTLVLEEDLNHSQDNFDICLKCKNKITIKASSIFFID